MKPENIKFRVETHSGAMCVGFEELDEIQIDVYTTTNMAVKQVKIKGIGQHLIDVNVESTEVERALRKLRGWKMTSKDLPGRVKRQTWKFDAKAKSEYEKFCEENGLTPIDKLRKM